MQRLSIQKGHAFMLLYSITSKQTLEELKPIYNQIREIKVDQHGETPILLMGCKLDEAACREVTETLGKQIASHWSCSWIETSAKNNTNIREAFQELLKLDKKRHFNFNVDQDGHTLDENGSTLTLASPSLNAGKRTLVKTASCGNSSHTTDVMTKDATMSPTATVALRGSKTKKTSRTLTDPSDTTTDNANKSSTHTETSSNKTLPSKCLMM
jgi:hypothetical protein